MPMRPVTIPIRSVTPEPDPGLEFMAMPREMATFEMPTPPEPGPAHDVAGARAVLAVFVEAFGHWLEHGGEPPALDLIGLPADTLRVLNETLGEGEVSAIADGDGSDDTVRVQETVFSGTWRQQHVDAGGVLRHDLLLAAAIPPLLPRRAQARAQAALRARDLPPGAMNVPALLHELQQAMDACAPEAPSHVINLTLLPLSPEDTAHLDAVLDGGSVVMLSRGFGNCRISSTAARDLWRVQYFNNMQTLILNTLEVVTIPEVAIAAREDLLESHARLVDLVQWMGESDTPH